MWTVVAEEEEEEEEEEEKMMALVVAGEDESIEEGFWINIDTIINDNKYIIKRHTKRNQNQSFNMLP